MGCGLTSCRCVAASGTGLPPEALRRTPQLRAGLAQGAPLVTSVARRDGTSTAPRGEEAVGGQQWVGHLGLKFGVNGF